MKLSLKLASAMVAMSIVSLVSFSIGIVHDYSETQLETAVSQNSNLIKSQCDTIGKYMKQVLNDTDAIASDVAIAGFSKMVSENSNDAESYREFANNELNSYSASNEIVISAGVCDSDGNILISTDSSLINTTIDFSVKLDNFSTETGGVSPLFEKNSQPVFMTVSPIGSGSDIYGYFYQINSVDFFISSLEAFEFDTVIMDYEGNTLQIVSKKAVLGSDSGSFSDYILSDVSVKSDEVGKLDSDESTYVYSVFGDDFSYYIVSDVHIGEDNKLSRAFNADVRSKCFIYSIIMVALSFVVASLLVIPIKKMAATLEKKRKGDMSAKFSESGKDEISYFGAVFNEIFDDMQESETRYRTIVEMTDNIVFEIDCDTPDKNVYVSNNFNIRYSFRPTTDALKDSFFYCSKIHKEDKDNFHKDFDSLLFENSDYMQGEYRFKDRYGDYSWAMIRAAKLRHMNGSAKKIVGIISDIDREKRSEINLIQKANFDALTKIYNRETFRKNLAGEIEISAMSKKSFAVMFIDLDDFKFYNDEYGHAVGDEVLKFVADEIQESVSGFGFGGRFGGDEFVICINQLENRQFAADMAASVIRNLGNGFDSDTGIHLNVKCSIGIAICPENGKTCDEIIHAADEAMYGIKKHGKSNYIFAE